MLFCILKPNTILKNVYDFVADFILGTQIPCARNRYSAFKIDLE